MLPRLSWARPASTTYRDAQDGAGGASAAIYDWLRIRDDPSFPSVVKETIDTPLKACAFRCGTNTCIHVVGPDLRQLPGADDSVVVQQLAAAYRAILAAFASDDSSTLHLLPVSSGIFAHGTPCAGSMPTLTFSALKQGFDMLPACEPVPFSAPGSRCAS